MTSGNSDRRQFLGAMATIGAMAAAGKGEAFQAKSGRPSIRWPKLTGSPVLDSLHPVIEHSRDVRTNVDKIVEVAGWMAYEELPMPDYQMPFGVGQGSADDVIDFILTADCVDTAFTDFSTHVKFQVDYAGRHWSDSDGLFACMKRAMDNGIPILDGKFLARVTRPEMERIFAANIELPMLDEKMEIWHQVGAVLAEKYDGRFHNFVKSCPPRLVRQRRRIDRPHGEGVSSLQRREPIRWRNHQALQVAATGNVVCLLVVEKDRSVPSRRRRQDDGICRLHRSRGIAAAGNHELFART